jgi:glycosyltransferase involved in cell wall biosynthesis
MTPPAPLVSVVIPVFNAGNRLREAIATIEHQRHEPLEIIVVDDGSTDDTSAVIRQLGHKVRALRQANAGPAAARNRGMAIARGELFAFLDADDLWPEGKLHHQVGRLTEDSEIDIVLGRISYVPESGSLKPELRWEDPEERTILNVQLGSGVYRRTAFERVGLFDESLRFCEDHDWFLRARELGLRIRILDEVTLLYRLHGDNMTRGKLPSEMSLTRVIKMSLDRRRSAGRADVELGDWREFDERPSKDPGALPS